MLEVKLVADEENKSVLAGAAELFEQVGSCTAFDELDDVLEEVVVALEVVTGDKAATLGRGMGALP